MKITRTSPITGTKHTMYIDVTVEQLTAWRDGMLIQKAMPNLTAGEREFIMTGLTSDNRDEIFQEEKREETENAVADEFAKALKESVDKTATNIAKEAIDHFLEKQTSQSPRFDRLPPYMQDGAKRYVEEGCTPGDFLQAVLENNLSGAYGYADDVNIREMYNWAMWLHNDIPALCWGTKDQVKAWCATGGLNGLKKASLKLSEDNQ